MAKTVQVQEETAGIKIRCKASVLVTAIERLCVPKGQEALVNPLPLRLTGEAIETASQSKYKALLVWGQVDLPHKGSGEIAVNPVELRGFLGLYGDQEVETTFGQDGTIEIEGPTRSSHLFQDAAEPEFRKSFPEINGDVAKFTKQNRETNWVGQFDASALKEASAPASLLGVKTWTLEANAEGLAIRVGASDAKSKAVRTFLPSPSTLEAAISTDVGEDFGTLVNALEGQVRVLFGNKTAVVIQAGGVNYMVTPRKE